MERADDERMLIINNDSSGPIRNVSILVAWLSERDKIENEPVPANGVWQILPRGRWLERRDCAHEKYAWGYPHLILADDYHRYTPLFFHTEDREETLYEIMCLKFTDTRGNTWERRYSNRGDTDPMLRKSSREEFRQFVQNSAV